MLLGGFFRFEVAVDCFADDFEDAAVFAACLGFEGFGVVDDVDVRDAAAEFYEDDLERAVAFGELVDGVCEGFRDLLVAESVFECGVEDAHEATSRPSSCRRYR
ncbi:hypothetical protein CCHOA_09650 [Corynebacterium choanae]|uniref:Uncharacterized protein n=1 Tax=Corynebacterium choanae TaxID=1862358 RepID=A0A3G6J962_9CORY|nr:hypothetical protein CCHOA_09650 [Corynebacterium choanae]